MKRSFIFFLLSIFFISALNAQENGFSKKEAHWIYLFIGSDNKMMVESFKQTILSNASRGEVEVLSVPLKYDKFKIFTETDEYKELLKDAYNSQKIGTIKGIIFLSNKENTDTIIRELYDKLIKTLNLNSKKVPLMVNPISNDAVIDGKKYAIKALQYMGFEISNIHTTNVSGTIQVKKVVIPEVTVTVEFDNKGYLYAKSPLEINKIVIKMNGDVIDTIEENPANKNPKVNMNLYPMGKLEMIFFTIDGKEQSYTINN